MDLYHLAEHCNYGTFHNELIQDRIVIGLRSTALLKKLQTDVDLTFENAVQMAYKDEMIRKQQTLLRNDFQDQKPGPRSKPELD